MITWNRANGRYGRPLYPINEKTSWLARKPRLLTPLGWYAVAAAGAFAGGAVLGFVT